MRNPFQIIPSLIEDRGDDSPFRSRKGRERSKQGMPQIYAGLLVIPSVAAESPLRCFDYAQYDEQLRWMGEFRSLKRLPAQEWHGGLSFF